MYIIHYYIRDRNAVLVARDVGEGLARLRMVDPRMGWENARYMTITPCRTSLTPRVLSLERQS